MRPIFNFREIRISPHRHELYGRTAPQKAFISCLKLLLWLTDIDKIDQVKTLFEYELGIKILLKQNLLIECIYTTYSISDCSTSSPRKLTYDLGLPSLKSWLEAFFSKGFL